ncbi:hypothetical protein HNP38_002695 [Chryseobacterium defluvii]|uniref:Uncharacterized protein n=1 Tax=Chryseobacterium defluvii TaxID=160396 RepID=A0A840KDC0_9FLAO|nr:hypothetical protein [Chryseobacterium defluvii]
MNKEGGWYYEQIRRRPQLYYKAKLHRKCDTRKLILKKNQEKN